MEGSDYIAIDSRFIETQDPTSDDPERELSTIEDFLELSTSELKYFLQNHGVSIIGCRAELAERAVQAKQRRNDAGPSEPKKFKIEREQFKGEYVTTLEEYGLTDPDVSNEWSVDISGLPSMDIGKIFHYILSKEAFDTYYLSEYKTKKAYQYLESICVRSIKLHTVADFIFVRGAMAPLNQSSGGFDPNLPESVIKVLTTSDGDIVVSGCSCTENLFQCCNHVIAVLFRMERLVRELDSRESQKKGVSLLDLDEEDDSIKPTKISDLFKKKDSLAQSLVGKIPKPTADEKRKFMEQICKTIPNCLFAQMFRGSIEVPSKLAGNSEHNTTQFVGGAVDNTGEESVITLTEEDAE